MKILNKKGFTPTPKFGVSLRSKRGFTLHHLRGKTSPASKSTKNGAGFTLVELLVVIAIIGLLTGMIVISIRHIKAKARDSQRVADINSIVTALTLYHNDFNAYPLWPEGGYINGENDPLSIALEDTGTISGVPTDPLNVGDYQYYYQSTDASDYYLEYYLETDSVSGKSKGRNYFVP